MNQFNDLALQRQLVNNFKITAEVCFSNEKLKNRDTAYKRFLNPVSAILSLQIVTLQ